MRSIRCGCHGLRFLRYVAEGLLCSLHGTGVSESDRAVSDCVRKAALQHHNPRRHARLSRALPLYMLVFSVWNSVSILRWLVDAWRSRPVTQMCTSSAARVHLDDLFVLGSNTVLWKLVAVSSSWWSVHSRPFSAIV